MAVFNYSAIEAATGRERRGAVEGGCPEEAITRLKARGLAPTQLLPASGTETSDNAEREPLADWARLVTDRSRGWRAAVEAALGAGRGAAVGARTRTLFTRQLATLLGAGMPLVRSLDVLARQQRPGRFRAVLEDLAAAIRAGGNLSDALQRHPRIFDGLYVAMIRAGEAGGVLEVVLERLAVFAEKTQRLKARIAAAMTYPAIVLLLAGGIMAALLVFVVPKFEQIFSGLLRGQPLPALTRAVLGVSGLVQHHLIAGMAIAAAAGAGLTLLGRTQAGRRAWDRLKLRVPVVGSLLLKTAIARFSRTLGTLLGSGVPILQALLITRDTSGNSHVAGAIAVVRERVKAGDTLARPLAATGVFPAMVTGLVEVGEETGELPQMLGRVADAYDEEVDAAVAGLTAMIEPLLIVLLAGLVGTVVIALFLPIVSVIQYLQ